MSRDRFRFREGELFEREPGLAPSLWDAIPGLQRNDAMALPETDDPAAFGGVGAELAAADEERRRARRDRAKRIAAERALRAMQGDGPEDPLASLQMDPEAVEAASERFDATIGDPVRAGAADFLDRLVLPRAALGALNEATGVDGYGNTVQRARQGAAEARAEHPWASAIGTVAAMPAALVSPQLAAPSAGSTMGRIGAAGIESMSYGALPGLVSGDLNEAEEGAEDAGLFAGLANVGGQVISNAAPYLSRAADSLDEWSAPIRARAAGIRGIAAQRLVDELPSNVRGAADADLGVAAPSRAGTGGVRGYVSDLDRLGISPRGSISRIDEVGERAEAARRRAIGGIQDARDRMTAVENRPFAQLDEAVRTDDPMMAPTPETSRALVSDRIRRGSEAERQAVDRAVAELDELRGEMGTLATQRARATTLPGTQVDVEAPTMPAAVGDITRPLGRARPRPVPSDDPTVPGINAEQIRELRRELNRRSGGRPNLSASDVQRAYDDGEFTEVFGMHPQLPNLQRQPGLPPRDARSPSTEDLRGLLPEGFGNTVQGPEVARRLRGILARYRQIPGAENLYATGERLASQMEARGPISWGEAEEIRRFWDDITNWQAQGPTASPLAPLQGVRRQMRGALQGVLDETVAEHAPDIAYSYPQARRDYQVADLTSRMAREDELRDASNRLISPSDYGGAIMGSGIGSAAGGPTAGVVGGIVGVGINRAVRGREHALSAAVAERGADAMRALPTLTTGRAGAPIMGAMGAAAARPEPRAQTPTPIEPREVSDDEFDRLLAAPQEPAAPPASSSPSEPREVSDDEFQRLLEQEFGQ
jgi:hypothetical protein